MASECAIWWVNSIITGVSVYLDHGSHLPVRGLWLHCGGCSHGGHHSCYRQFYSTFSFDPVSGSILDSPSPATQPTPHLSSGPTAATLAPSQTRPEASHSTEFNTGRRKLHGLPCATGCGHLCFAGEERFLTTPLPGWSCTSFSWAPTTEQYHCTYPVYTPTYVTYLLICNIS